MADARAAEAPSPPTDAILYLDDQGVMQFGVPPPLPAASSHSVALNYVPLPALDSSEHAVWPWPRRPRLVQLTIIQPRLL